MLAETAKLAIQLDLKGNAAAGIRGVEQRLTGLNRQTGQIGQGFKTMGAGIGVAARNIVLLGTAVVGGLAAGLIKSVKEGQEAAKVQTIYANAIQNSGKVSTQYVDILNKQQTALMNLAGIDDELIKSSQTRLIQMGLTGEQVAKVTPLVLDFAKATGLDLETATKLTGKSINGNIGALSRYGVQVDKAKAKVDPFAATVDALNSKFAGTTKALSGSLEVRLGALRENLANVREEAGMKLLPALTKIVDVAGRKLVPAFGAFVDRILPSVIAGVDKFAAILEGGGAERGIKGITDALGPMVEMLKIAAAPVKLIVDAFLKLPSQVQGVLIGAFAVNKLSGGLIGSGVGQIAKGVIGGVAGGLLQRGSSPATPLFVSDVAGGGIAGAAGKGILGTVLKFSAALGLAAVALELWQNSLVPLNEANAEQTKAIETGVKSGLKTATTDQLRIQRDALQAGLNKILATTQGLGPLQDTLFGGQIKGLRSDLQLVTDELANRDNSPEGREQRRILLRLVQSTDDRGRETRTIAGTMTKLQVQMHVDFTTAIGELRTANDPTTIAAAAAQIVALTKGGVGSAATTRGAIGDLTTQRDAALAAGNRDLANVLTAAIKQLDPFAKGRDWQAKQLRAAQDIKNSNKSVADKVTALKGIEADLLSHQRTMAAQIVQGLLNVVTAVHGIKLPAGQTPIVNPQTGFVTGGTPIPKPKPKAEIRNGFTVNANVNVSTRDVNTAQSVKARYGPTPTQAGAA